MSEGSAPRINIHSLAESHNQGYRLMPMANSTLSRDARRVASHIASTVLITKALAIWLGRRDGRN
jgi:hypothetical protein